MRWKALAGAAVAVALVIAPLTMSGASAHTGDLHASASCDPETGTYTVTYTLEFSDVPAGRVGTTKWRVGDSSFAGTPTSAAGMTGPSITSTGNQTITLGTSVLPGDTVNGPWVYAFTTWQDGDGRTISRGSDGRIQGLEGDCEPPKKVFVCKYVGTPGVDERLQTGGNPVNPSINSIKGNFPEGHVIAVGDTFSDGHGRSVVIALDTGQPAPSIEACAPPSPDAVKPGPPVVKDLCETANDHYGLPEPTAGIVYSRDGLSLVATLAGPQYTFDLTGTGWVANQNGTATYFFDEEEFTDVNCEDVVPLPAQFSADPLPPACETAGSLPDLADAEHVTLSVAPAFTGPGTYKISADTDEGYEFSDGATHKERTATVLGAIGFQSENPTAPCFLAVLPAPEAPTAADECGTENDVVTVPEDTEAYTYEVSEEGDTVFVEAVLVNEEDTFPEGTVTEWEFTFTDEPCPTPTPPSALPATGGTDMTPWGIGAAVMLLAGAALLTIRRLARN